MSFSSDEAPGLDEVSMSVIKDDHLCILHIILTSIYRSQMVRFV